MLRARIFISQSRDDNEKESLIQAEAALARIGRDGLRAKTLDRLDDIHLAQSMCNEAMEFHRLGLAIFSSMGDFMS